MKYLILLLLISGCTTERDCTGQEDRINELVKECVANAKGKLEDSYGYNRVLYLCMQQYKELYCPYKNENEY